MGGLFFYLNEPLPEGKKGEAADELAHMVLDAINHEEYERLGTISWTYKKDQHHFIWDKRNNVVNVRWEDYEVDFYPDNMKGSAKKGNETLTGESLERTINQAWSLFANDSFWLVAPFKIFDPGTIRNIVETEDGPALMITYQSGGVTPGDSYLWMLGSDFKPKSWKMWTQIIPIGGVTFSWEQWENHEGVWFAPIHRGLVDIDIIDLRVTK